MTRAPLSSAACMPSMKLRFAKSHCWRMTPIARAFEDAAYYCGKLRIRPRPRNKKSSFPVICRNCPRHLPRNPPSSPRKSDLSSRNSFPPFRKISLANNPAAQSPLDFSREPGYGLLLQPIPKLKVFAIVIVEETEAPAFWAPAFAPAVPRDLCTRCGASGPHARCGCTSQFIKPNGPRMEASVDGWARNPRKSVERFFAPFRRMTRAAPTRAEMKALEFVLHVKPKRPRRMRDLIPQEIWHLAARMRQTRKFDESSIRDEEMLAIPWNS